MGNLFRDLRHALRGLLRTPAFTLPLVLTLALGLGANMAVFTVLSGVLLRPLPFAQPERLVRVFETFPFEGGPAPGGKGWGSVSVPNLREWQEQAKSFTALAPYFFVNMNLQSGGEPERLRAVQAGDELFTTLGVPPIVGRGLAQGDSSPSRTPVAVLSYALWQRRFAGDPQIVGRTVTLDGEAHTVVGVMGRSFDFPPGWTIDAWVPLRPSAKEAADRGSHWLNVVGRLRPEVGVAKAQAEMEAIANRIQRANPDTQEGRSAWVVPFHDDMVGPVRPKLLLLSLAAALVLLIACANAANLLLARAVGRRRELGVRAALGASTVRLVRFLLLEAGVVTTLGALVGVALAVPAVRGLLALANSVLPDATAPRFDGRVFAFVLLVVAITTLVTAAAPVLVFRRHALREELQAGARSGADRGSRGLRSGLVVSQVALSTVLLVGTGLLLKSLATVLSVQPGISTAHVIAMRLSVPVPPGDGASADGGSKATETARLRVYDRVRDRVASLPGVVAAGWTSHLPLRDWGWNGDFGIEGVPKAADPVQQPRAEYRIISAGYMQALGVRIVRGRDLTAADGVIDAPPVALVNEALARRYFSGADPVGRRLIDVDPEHPVPIVGVVASFHQTTLDKEPLPEIYLPTSIGPRPTMSLVVRSQLPAAATLPMVQAAIRQVAPDLPVFGVTTMSDVVDHSVADRRLVMILLSVFALVALALSGAGIYGLLAYVVAQGRREISIRMALGAAQRTILQRVLTDGGILLGGGLALGGVLALGATRLLRSLLYGVEPSDPTVLAAVLLTLVVTGLLALWLPARRAMRTDPALVLRGDP